jgi:hypothetical protein
MMIVFSYHDDDGLLSQLIMIVIIWFPSPGYPKHGDDSAISVGSGRGGMSEMPYGGMQADSEYSYEYGVDHNSGGSVGRDPLDAGWLPPDDISALSVTEVSRSLRYIGMKVSEIKMKLYC